MSAVRKRNSNPCKVCNKVKKKGVDFWICCDICNKWYHNSCVGLGRDEENRYNGPIEWKCLSCVQSTKENSQHNKNSSHHCSSTIINKDDKSLSHIANSVIPSSSDQVMPIQSGLLILMNHRTIIRTQIIM